MPVGLRIRDPITGDVISDPTMFWGRVTHVQDIAASSSGSYSVPDLPAEYGTPFIIIQPVDAGFAWASSASLLSFGGSGGTVTYTNGSPYALKVIHGIN